MYFPNLLKAKKWPIVKEGLAQRAVSVILQFPEREYVYRVTVQIEVKSISMKIPRSVASGVSYVKNSGNEIHKDLLLR